MTENWEKQAMICQPGLRNKIRYREDQMTNQGIDGLLLEEILLTPKEDPFQTLFWECAVSRLREKEINPTKNILSQGGQGNA